jgi:hypothetical protein
MFFSGARLGMNILDARVYYQKLGNVAAVWHGDAPAGQPQVDFRITTSEQRRVYVYYSLTDNRIVSVSYWKLGRGETFSEAERNYLVNLNGSRDDLTIKITSPSQFQIESRRQQ